tara:strand:+ start:3876 stop:4190 length:315 start_codon:yes stop_codon:yes gene_type:complete
MLKFLKNVKKATTFQKKNELWDVEGILKNRLNQKLKFDLRPIKNNCKIGSFKTKADKMVFESKDQWIIVDVEEMHQFLREKSIKDVYLEDLISELDWNIILPKK